MVNGFSDPGGDGDRRSGDHTEDHKMDKQSGEFIVMKIVELFVDPV